MNQTILHCLPNPCTPYGDKIDLVWLSRAVMMIEAMLMLMMSGVVLLTCAQCPGDRRGPLIIPQPPRPRAYVYSTGMRSNIMHFFSCINGA